MKTSKTARAKVRIIAARYGETGYGAAYLLPISVDGLVTVASVSLVEITARIRAATQAPGSPAEGPQATTRTAAAKRVTQPNGSSATDVHVNRTDPASVNGHANATQAAARTARPSRTRTGRPRPTTHDRSTDAAGSTPTRSARPLTRAAPSSAPPSPASGPAAPTGQDRESGPDSSGTPPADLAPAGTPAAVAYWRRRDPTLHPAEIAARIGRSERTVRRHWKPAIIGAPGQGQPGPSHAAPTTPAFAHADAPTA